jgi:hypothetical protein
MNELGDLAGALADKNNDPLGGLRNRSGVVTAVNRTTNAYSVTIGGTTFNDVKAHAHVQAGVGETVDVLIDGPAPRIIGTYRASPWHVVGAAGEPAFQNNWRNNGGVEQTAAFMKDPFGFVHLRGLVVGGPPNTMAFTLPSGYWPSLNEVFPLITSVAFHRGVLVVGTNGGTNPVALESGSVFVSLAGVTFYAP